MTVAFHHTIRGGTKKFPEFKKKYLKCLNKFETLVPFEVLPLRLDAAIPAPLPTGMLSRTASDWRSLTAFPLKILDNVSSIGSGAGIAASSRRGSTSKGTKVSNFYKYFKYIFLTIPEIFGSPPPYIKTPTDFGSSQFPVDEDRYGPRNGGLLVIKPSDKADRTRIFYGVK